VVIICKRELKGGTTVFIGRSIDHSKAPETGVSDFQYFVNLNRKPFEANLIYWLGLSKMLKEGQRLLA
jgi:hypothetical protein